MALTHDIHRAGAIAGDSRSGPPVMEPNRHGSHAMGHSGHGPPQLLVLHLGGLHRLGTGQGGRSASRAPWSRRRSQSARCDEHGPSQRRSGPGSPRWVQASVSRRIRSPSWAEKRRRVGIRTTSGSAVTSLVAEVVRVGLDAMVILVVLVIHAIGLLHVPAGA